MVYLANKSHAPRHAEQILLQTRKAVPEDVIVRDVRVANSFVEVDCSIPDHLSLNEVLGLLSRLSPVLEFEQIVERHMDNHDAIRHAVYRFNEQKYWSAHEALEQVWRRSSGNEKDLLNGIILVGAAMVHYQKDEIQICISIMKRAQAKFLNSSGTYYGIDVDRLKLKILEILATGAIEAFSI